MMNNAISPNPWSTANTWQTVIISLQRSVSRRLTINRFVAAIIIICTTLVISWPAVAQDPSVQRTPTQNSPAQNSATHSQTAQNTTAHDYRQALYELVYELEQYTHTSRIPETVFQPDYSQINAALLQIPDRQLMALNSGSVPIRRIHNAIRVLRTQRQGLIDQQAHANDMGTVTQPRANNTPIPNTIEFPVPEPLSACANTTPAEAYRLLISFSVAEEVLATAKWLCEQLEAGENGALACAAIGITTRELEGLFEFSEFCLANIQRADGTALLETQRNVGAHLNSMVDATTSSRATQDSLDALQADITSANNQLTRIQTDIDEQFTTVSDDLIVALSDLTTLSQRQNGLIAQVMDLQFRLQISQVDLQDIQLRIADLQQDALEIRSDTQNLITQLHQLSDGLSGHRTELNQEFTQDHRDTIASVLANPDLTVMRYVLPVAQGGALEEVREVLVQAIIAADGLGMKTNTARDLLAQGDQAYAQQNYAGAYNRFVQAYQSLNSNNSSSPVIAPRSTS